MKTIKFLSFAVLLSLSWVACKDANTSSTETSSAEAVADSIYTSNKNMAAMNMSALREGVTVKITELEAALATATDATKAEITTQLDTYKKFQADLDAASAKVAAATPETWATVQAEVDAVHFAVKSSLTGANASNQLSN
jgi:hypothetical protein